MNLLPSLLKSPDSPSRSRGARMLGITLAVLTPLLVAGIAVAAVTHGTTSASGTPNLPAAVVNLDTPLETTINGTKTPVAAGKLLTEELVSTNTSGFTWTLTNEADAEAGLAAGTYSAVVTVPSNFSALYISSSGTAPEAATLAVQTNGAQSYVSHALASALASDVQASLSTGLTQNFVKGLLVGFTDLHTQLTTVAGKTQLLATGATQLAGYTQQAADGTALLDTGAQQLSSGMNTLSSVTAALPKATSDLALGAQIAEGGTSILSSGLNDMVTKQRDVETKQQALDTAIAALKTDLPTLTPAEISARLDTLQADSAAISLSSLGVGVSLDVAAAGTSVLHSETDLLSQGSTALANAMPQLTTGISGAADGASKLSSGISTLSAGSAQIASGAQQLATGSGALATGLGQAATAVPSYTAAEQTTLSTVVSSPITTTMSDTAPVASASAAVAGIMIPVALWLGAFALYLLLAPFTGQALRSSASTWSIARQSLQPALLLGLVQAIVVLIGLSLLGVTAGHRIGTVLFVLGLSVAFVALHQGLVSAFGRVGRMLSLAFLVLQVVAAGILIPAALSPAWFGSLSSIFPLAAAVQGLQLLLTGASLGSAIAPTLWLVIVAGIGVALTLIAISRRRSVKFPHFQP